jgi:hypothetical protein
MKLPSTWARAGFALGAIAACATLWLVSLIVVGDFQVDDAYITFAFSKNLATGNGPIYGYDLRVEGYSNFLWMVLVAIGMFFGGDPLTAARVLAHAAFALLVWSSYRGARALSGRIPALLSAIAIASCSDLTRAAQSGLETVAYAAFVTATFSEYLVEHPKARKASMIWAALGALTRIDGFVPLLTLAGLEALRSIVATRTLPRSYFRWLLWGAGPTFAYWIWRYSYYSLPLPLPFYAKASQTISGASSGLDYLRTATIDLSLWIPALLALLGLPRPLDRRTLVLGSGVLVGIAYVVYVGGDWMPMHRMLLPLLGPLWMLGSLGLQQLWGPLLRGKFGRTTTRFGAVLLTLLAMRFMNQTTIDTDEERHKVAHADGLGRHTRDLLRALPFLQATQRKPGERLVTDYGGVFAVGTEARVIEMWGLCNREIALRGNSDGINPVYGKTCVSCYPELKPDYFHVVVPLLRRQGAINSVEQAIAETFQGHALDRVLHLRRRFELGAVTRPATRETLYFLERKRPELSYEPRRVGDLHVSYPRLSGELAQ